MTTTLLPPRRRPEAPPGPTPPIDPRLGARRSEVERGAAARRRRRVGAVAGTLLLAALAYLLTRSPWLSVDAVRVSGAERTALAAIVAATGIERGDPLTDVDLVTAERGVEALPWVAEADVARDWPRGVTVEVRERTAEAAARTGPGEWRWLDRTGRVLAIGTLPPPDLVSFVAPVPLPGPGAVVPPEAAPLLRTVLGLPASLAPRVQEVAPDGRGNVVLLLADGGQVWLGPPDDLDAKLVAAAAVLDTLVATGALTPGLVLDVRVPSAPVLTGGPS